MGTFEQHERTARARRPWVTPAVTEHDDRIIAQGGTLNTETTGATSNDQS